MAKLLSQYWRLGSLLAFCIDPFNTKQSFAASVTLPFGTGSQQELEILHNVGIMPGTNKYKCLRVIQSDYSEHNGLHC